MIEINLLPDRMRARIKASHQHKEPTLAAVPKAFPIALGGLALLMGLLVVVTGSTVGANERKSKQIERDLMEATTRATEAETVIAGMSELTGRYTVLATRLDAKVHWADLMRAISMRCPPGVRITEIKLERDRRTGTPSKLKVSGIYSGSDSLEMRFADELNESATFKSVFNAVLPEKRPMGDVTTFSISCMFRQFRDELLKDTDTIKAPPR